MHTTHAPARAMSLFSVALLLGASTPLLAATTAEAGSRYFEEDWELGSSGWTYSTEKPIAQQDCTGTVAYRGLCSIEISSQVNGQVSSASRSFANLQFTGPGYVVSDYFRNDWPYLRSGGAMIVQFGSGAEATLNLSYGSGNQVALSTDAASTGGLTTPGGQQWMYAEKTWYRTLLKVDLVNNNVRVEIRDTSDTLLATGPALAIPAGAGASIERIAFEGYYFGNSPVTEKPQKINYDWLTVSEPDPPTAPRLLTALPGPSLGEITVSWQMPSDDGGVPLLRYNVYRGDSAGSVTTLIGNTTTRSFVDSGMANGEAYYYAVRAVNAAGEGATSNVALGTTFNVPTAPRNLAANSGSNVGEIHLTWQPPANTGGAPITNYRIYRGSQSGAATFLTDVGNVLSYTDTHLPNGTRWYYNVTAVNFVGEGPTSIEADGVPKPDGATAATAIVLRPDPWWTNQPRELNFTYDVAVSQCEPTQSCPVSHEWRVYQDGSLTGADGLLLLSGTNTHSGHAETTTYNVSTTVTPTGLDGTHRLKVLVSPRMGSSEWRVASVSFQNGLPQPDPACNANPGFSTYLMPGVAPAPESGWQYEKTYRYKLNGTVSATSATFVDGCPTNDAIGPGDGFYEIGYGGVLLDQLAFGAKLQLPDSTGNFPTFVLGTDMDGSGVIGDSGLDCFQGPAVFVTNVTCPPDASGKIVALLVPSSTPVGSLPTADDPIWGRAVYCRGDCINLCEGENDPDCSGGGGGGSGIPFLNDPDGDGLGKAFEDNVHRTAGEVDRILGAAFDQEFMMPCGPLDCVGKGVGDGLKNLEEFRWGTWPLGPLRVCTDNSKPETCLIVFQNARDFDNDSWEDGPEWSYWNNPENDLVLNDPTWAAIQSAPQDEDRKLSFDNGLDAVGTLHDPDNDDDGLKDGVEYRNWTTYPEFPDSDCALEEKECGLPGPSYWSLHQGAPGTGDHINDERESVAWGANWRQDFDGDGIATNLLDPDADADGLLDGAEFPRAVGGKCDFVVCTDPAKFDTDSDGLLDGFDTRVPAGDYRIRLFVPAGIAYDYSGGYYTFYGEATARTTRTDADSDDDGLPDGWEVKYQTDPLAQDADDDSDGDWLSNLIEYRYGCNTTPCPTNPVYWGGTNPSRLDSDGDFLFDGGEDANQDGAKQDGETSPIEPDTDRDGLKDGDEVHNSLNPSSPVRLDSDGDGLTDYQEVVTYAAKHVLAMDANSDDCCNTTNQDTLNDYQEIVVYRTNPGRLDANRDGVPDGWDTDGDGVADGRDPNPTIYNSPPPAQRELPPLNPFQPKHPTYVRFSDHYVDVSVTDAHGAEGDIELVEVKVILEGTVDGVANSIVKIREEARRLDEGVWGVRIPLPARMSEADRETFTLTIVTSDGGNANYTRGEAYGATFTQRMTQVQWNEQSDPADDWQQLEVHENMPAQTSTSSGFNGAPLVPTIPDPWALSVDELKAAFGNFTVYRVKAGAVLASELENVTAETGNTSAFAIAHPLNVTAGENASVTLEFTYFENAFELVDPLVEPGVYASMAGGGSNSFRSPKFIHTGVRWAWNGLVDTATREGASLLFGSDDPRAQGAIVGDIVSGILVYGDVRDCYFKDDAITVALGCVGIALTFVGPQADGPFAAFKAGVKTITSIPNVGPKMALKFIKEVKEVALRKNVGETFQFLLDHCAVLSWVRKHREQAVDFTRLQYAVSGTTLNSLKNSLDDAVALSADVAKAAPEGADQIDNVDTTAKKILRHWEAPSDLYPDGKGLEDMSGIMGMVRDSACANCKANLGQMVKDLYDLEDVDGLFEFWNKADGARKRLMLQTDPGRWGTVFEILQSGKLKRGELEVYNDDLVKMKLGLHKVDDTRTLVLPGGREVTAQFDAWALFEGKRVATEFKTGANAANGIDIYDQMERQLAVAQRLANLEPGVYAREIHWRFDTTPEQGAKDVALALMEMYPDMKVRFFTSTGFEIPIV